LHNPLVLDSEAIIKQARSSIVVGKNTEKRFSHLFGFLLNDTPLKGSSAAFSIHPKTLNEAYLYKCVDVVFEAFF
jgi:hypothetical protein